MFILANYLLFVYIESNNINKKYVRAKTYFQFNIFDK